MLFRGICLNDNIGDFHEFKKQFINHMISRKYHPAQIRKILRLKNIPKYIHRKIFRKFDEKIKIKESNKDSKIRKLFT